MKAKPSAEELAVYLNENRIGTLARLKGGKLQFAYDEGYQAGVPLSYSMPIANRIHEDATVSPFLWNLLPDNTRLLATWGRQYQVNPSSAFALLKEIGDDCAGAVRFVSPDRIDNAQNGGLSPISESEIGQRLSNLENDPAAARSLSDEGRFSLAGAQAKIALRLEGDSWHIPWGHEPTTHILKPPRSDFAGHAENEHFCLKLASALDMRAAQTSVQSFAGSKAIVVKRFDRMLHQGKLYRVHQEDMCQALAVGPANKYESDGGPGVPDIMQIVSGSQRRLEDRDALINAIVFNYLILGTDAHAKNYSILHTAEGFILAPLYDIASFAPYVKSPKDERLAMRIDRYYKVAQIRQRHFERMARSCNYPSKKLLASLEKLALAIPSACDQVGTAAIKEGLNATFIEKLVSTLRTRSQQALETIVATG
ncbi:type II toxin-antitoxin system HipA family toxin [Pelagicoccus enzymogenes]|uniref:type II toxin-antitoxin system HipA family toxin n=1 Tax=Pelagicoccus enzymogenes TaxID=2773457 RepID=UPI00280FD77B|nr:type II toxin-antitoxin system HipA family toxin [Pelagicoccus enzymogenes]MDQ8200304.1 type II toxin-antitoxin system HipA family toxin [Pelagicoccus enzymogenes]